MPEKCFVIMPFGEKQDIDGEIIDFDKVYKFIIKKAIEGLGIECIRCDEIAGAGWIHSKMINHIFNDEIAVVDITSLNANVFYELGVRHALKSSVTVLIRKKGTRVPFNIEGFKVIDYDPKDMESVDEAKGKIAEFVSNGLKEPDSIDSVVYEVLNDLSVTRDADKPTQTWQFLTKSEKFEYPLKNSPDKRIGLYSGDIRNVKDVDIWVNSENTNMQMARYYDRSVSAMIRYLGAKKNIAGHIEEDAIADELTNLVGSHVTVQPAHVIATGAGELEKTNGVKKIFHAASVSGQIAHGYQPIANIEDCISNALNLADRDFADAGLKTILFPLMGTGTGRFDLKNIAKCLLETAINYLDTHPDSTIECAYFLTWKDIELDTCRVILAESGSVVI